MELVPDDVFGDDYLPFYGDVLEERAEAETDLIWRLAGLRAGQRVLDAPERIVVRDGQVRRTSFSLRVPALSELAAWLRTAGFEQIDAYDETGGEYTTSSRRLIVLAR